MKHATKLLALALCIVLIGALCACSLRPVTDSVPETAAGKPFLNLEDPSLIESVTIAYTSVLTETETRTLHSDETIAALCQSLMDAAGTRESVAWNPITNSTDGGEGYVFTLDYADGGSCTLRFVLNPTLGYLSLTEGENEALYFSVGEDALKQLATFYPA